MADKIKERIKKQARSGPIILPIIFVLAGALLIANLLNITPLVQNIPYQVLEWITALGSLTGGLYMLYRRFFKRKVYV